VGGDTPRSAEPEAVVLDLPDLAEVRHRFDPGRLVVFDDGGTFSGRAAIVVQTSLPEWTGTGTVGEVLAGFGYAPVGTAYQRLRVSAPDGVPDRPGSAADGPPQVVVCFGGSDPGDVLGRIGPALLDDPDWVAELVVGADYRGIAGSWSPPVLRDPPDLPERIAAADLVVVGAGTMKFEAACVGRPAVILAVADDQLPGAPIYAQTRAALYCGDGRTIDPAVVRAAVAGLVADEPGRRAMGRRAAELIDGQGAARIAAAVLAMATAVILAQ